MLNFIGAMDDANVPDFFSVCAVFHPIICTRVNVA